MRRFFLRGPGAPAGGPQENNQIVQPPILAPSAGARYNERSAAFDAEMEQLLRRYYMISPARPQQAVQLVMSEIASRPDPLDREVMQWLWVIRTENIGRANAETCNKLTQNQNELITRLHGVKQDVDRSDKNELLQATIAQLRDYIKFESTSLGLRDMIHDSHTIENVMEFIAEITKGDSLDAFKQIKSGALIGVARSRSAQILRYFDRYCQFQYKADNDRTEHINPDSPFLRSAAYVLEALEICLSGEIQLSNRQSIENYLSTHHTTFLEAHPRDYFNLNLPVVQNGQRLRNPWAVVTQQQQQQQFSMGIQPQQSTSHQTGFMAESRLNLPAARDTKVASGGYFQNPHLN
ncbi:unnamed protein product [Amoebophrya sp. A120]|nr:unnamed protein product [Amoebophrya sp. A120]|eukprot:GSA120T00020765001.1